MKEEKDIIIKENISTELAETMSLGDIFVKSGFFSDTKSQAQAVVKILAGKELGLSPLQAMNSLYIVNGKIGMAAQLMSSLIKSSGKYDYHLDILDNEKCIVTFYQINGERKEIGKSNFTKEDAVKCGLVNKTSFQNFPRNMLFSRALSNGFRWYCPDALKVRIYTIEEIQDVSKIKGKVKSEEVIDTDTIITCADCKRPVMEKFIFQTEKDLLCQTCYDKRKEKK